MTSKIDDDDLPISISSSNLRRPSAQSTATPPTQRQKSGKRTESRAHKRERDERLTSQYEVVKTLGEGSFGRVELAKHKFSNNNVALKTILREKVYVKDMQGRIDREIAYLQLLRHPHIIKLFTVVRLDDRIVMVLEYAEGELFDHIVKHGKFSERKARRFFQQIICAVDYCHRHNIVHRDLKPENLLLDEKDNIKIADFGLSNIISDGNFLKTSCGSPNYAAPEVISGKLYAGPEVDIWSCGVILYVLLCGKLPFDDEFIPQLFKKIAAGIYQPPTNVSPGANRMIKRMLQVNPVNRITMKEIMDDSWFSKDLPEYLKPVQDAFLNTGMDPSKAIDPRRLLPGGDAAAAAKLHKEVIMKLGRKMGYGKGDIQSALDKDEPNAIKDAYLIVAENQVMLQNPAMQGAQLEPFLASSPTQPEGQSPLAAMMESGKPSPSSSSPTQHKPGGVLPIRQAAATRPSRTSTVSVLPTSVPDIHKESMEGKPLRSDVVAFAQRYEQQVDERSEEKNQMSHNIRGRTRSHNKPEEKPEAGAPQQTGVKKKNTRWQFGIRSRNSPADAMLAIYKALKGLGAQWVTPEIRQPGSWERERGQDDTGSSSETSDKEEAKKSSESKRSKNEPRSEFGSWNDWGYQVPQEVWVIKARFRKTGMLRLSQLHPNSASSSYSDVQTAAKSSEGSARPRRKRGATTSSVASGASQQDTGSHTGPPSAGEASVPRSTTGSATSLSRADTPSRHGSQSKTPHEDSMWIYMTIQLFTIESEYFTVDFKCSGYERYLLTYIRQVEDTMKQEIGLPGPVTNDDQDFDASQESDISEAKKRRKELTKIDENQYDYMGGGRPPLAGQWEAMEERRKQRKAAERAEKERQERERLGKDEHEDISTAGKSDSQSVEESGIKWRAVEKGEGLLEIKEKTSPFPFLDVAGGLIVRLAES